MTAYEIADDLEQAANLEMELDRPENWADLKTAAEIIRQLATEKAELEKESANLQHSLKNALIFIDNHKQTKPLSDEDILDLWVKKNKLNGASDIIEFAREIRGEK